MQKILLLVAFLSMCLVGRHADADSIYTLDYDSCTGGCGNGLATSNNSFGIIDLSQFSANQVQVTLQITDPSFIVNTGSGTNHAPFAFNTDKDVTIGAITDGVSSPSIYFTAGATNAAVSGLGTFNYQISCTSNCSPGASNGGEGTYLSFLVTANSGTLNLADFIANANGFDFATDIIGPSGLTGEVAANQPPTVTTGTAGSGGGAVPEPASLTLMGAGLTALGALRRRRAKSRR